MNPPPLRASGLATAGLGVALIAAGVPLGTAAAPLGMIDLELASSAARVDAVLASWRAAGLGMPAAWATQVLDCAFPVAYGAFGAALALRYAGRLGRGAAGAFVVSGALDLLVENPLLCWMMWTGGDDGLARVSSAAAALKLGLLGLGLAGVAVGRGLGGAPQP